MIIAVDGPTASGKNTTCALLAKRLGIVYLNSGSLYRAVAYAVLELSPEEEESYLQEHFPRIKLMTEDGMVHFYYEGDNITKRLQDNDVSQRVSHVASISLVRERVNAIAQKFGQHESLVIDGRDATTVIFPKADFKFFLQADLDVRAMRRHKDVLNQGKQLSLEEVKEQIRIRDENDYTTSGFDPKNIPGMSIVDTSKDSPEEIVDHIYSLIKQHE